MSNPYTSQSIINFNVSPPPDDGTDVASNEIKWSNHKEKLADPIKTLAEAINTQTLSAFGLTLGQTYSSHSTAYTVVAADRGKFLLVTGTTTITLLAVATAGTGFPLVIINNGTSNVTIDGNSSETINGSTTLVLFPGEMALLTCNGTSWAALQTKHRVRFVKGADVASASALALGSDGNYFDVTGTTAITSIGTVEVGTIVKLHFDGALTLTHHATDLILPGGANITTAAGDEAEFIEYATGDWRCTNYQRAGGVVYADLSIADSIQTSDLDISNSEGIYQFESGNWDSSTAYQVDGSVDGTSWVEYERRRIYIPANANSIHGQCNHHRHPSFGWNAEARLTISGVGSGSAVATASVTYEINSIPSLSVSALEGWYTLILEHRTVQATAEGRSYMDGFAAKLI